MDYSTYNSLYSDYGVSDYSSVAEASDAALALLGGVILGFLGLILIIALVISVIKIIANWKLFTKAGEKGWKAIIPFYNTAILFKISGMSPWLVLLYLGMFIPVLNVFVGIIFSVLNLYQPINLAKGFKKSTGFTVGMIMLPFVFNLILGFGKSEYYGFDEIKSEEPVEVKSE